MKLKKPITVKPATTAPAAAPAEGGATIADRFKLDPVQPAQKPAASGGIGALIALIAAFVGLFVTGALTFIIYSHWEYLKDM